MFCDLRGFSRRSERDAKHLLDLLERVSGALGVMTRHILDSGGVIGDFHGDAAMGFWGWPLDQGDSAKRAAHAALQIREENHRFDSPEPFQCGIGIASGRAVAGRIGTIDQVKVTAFGPVVNLASRLEGMNKAFGCEIIVDQATVDEISDVDEIRTRRLARVLPSGLEHPIDIFQVLPVDSADEMCLTMDQISQYESSLNALIDGHWDDAYSLLHSLPAWDRPKDVLLATILQHNRTPPPSWTGVIELPKL